jgi:hypothetical protein
VFNANISNNSAISWRGKISEIHIKTEKNNTKYLTQKKYQDKD